MTQNKKFKRAVRERMEKTGESYTTARLHLMKERETMSKESEALTAMLRRMENPVRPEELEAYCGEGHLVVMDCSNANAVPTCRCCGNAVASWQNERYERTRDGLVDQKAGWVVTAAGEAPCLA